MAQTVTNTTQEAETGIINIDDDPYAVERMIEYMYNDTYSNIDLMTFFNEIDITTKTTSTNPPYHLEQRLVFANLLLHARLYALGELYHITALKPLAKSKFQTTLSSIPDFGGFLDSVREIYSSTPAEDRGLRDIVVVHAVERSKVFSLDFNVATDDIDEWVTDFNRALQIDRRLELEILKAELKDEKEEKGKLAAAYNRLKAMHGQARGKTLVYPVWRKR